MTDVMADAMSNMWMDMKKPRKPLPARKPVYVQRQQQKVVYVQRQPQQQKVVYVQSKPVKRVTPNPFGTDPYLAAIRKQRMMLEEKKRLAVAREQYKPYRFSQAKNTVTDISAGVNTVSRGTGYVAKKTYSGVSKGVGAVVKKLGNKPEAINEYRGSLYKTSWIDRLRGKNNG